MHIAHARPATTSRTLGWRLGLGAAAVALASASWAQPADDRARGDAPGHSPMQQRSPGGLMPGQDLPRSPDGQRAAGQLADADREFLQQAAQNNHAELQASRTALDRSQNAEVRKFAQHMVEEHTRAGQQLEQLARAQGLDLPDGASLMHKGKHGLLMATTGASFDRRYSDTMGREAHRQNIELYEQAEREARDPEVKAFAAQALPMLRRHLELAQALPSGDEGNNAARDQGGGATPGVGTGGGAGSPGGQTGG